MEEAVSIQQEKIETTSKACEQKNCDSKYTAFEDLQITTMTHIVHFNGSIDRNNAFHFLTCCKPDGVEYKKFTKVYPSGTNIAMCSDQNYRGLNKKRAENSRAFRNAVTVDLSVGNKNLNCKICE
jgi:hypothetical protein